MKKCKDLASGCDFCCMECEVPNITPEWCEDCAREAEESGFDYEFNVTYQNGYWECGNCRQPV